MGQLSGFLKFFLNPVLRWLLLTIIIILNFIAYYQDPLRYSMTPSVLIIPNKWFAFLSGITTWSLDFLTFLGLEFTIPFATFLPSFWYLPFLCLGYGIITQITLDSRTYTAGESLDPPPKELLPKSDRIILYGTILVLDIIIFLQLYFASGIADITKNTVLEKIFLQRFGGLKQGGLQFLVAWMGLIGVIIDIFSFRTTYLYEACKYNLPKSWDF